MIGGGGATNLNMQVGPAPHFQARYTITNVRQNAGVWEYELTSISGFTPTQWVRGDDAAWGLSPVVPPNPLVATIGNLLRPNPAGTVKDWAAAGQQARASADDVSMGFQATRKNDQQGNFILWSGSAADCVIVAARGATHSYITHRDRGAPAIGVVTAALRDLGPGTRVYLASQMFGIPSPSDSALIRETVEGIGALAPQAQIVAIYTARALALNIRNGETRAGTNAVTDHLL
ncbi:MAG: hypothetical protein ACQSGP_23665 [Frankia sp.]